MVGGCDRSSISVENGLEDDFNIRYWLVWINMSLNYVASFGVWVTSTPRVHPHPTHYERNRVAFLWLCWFWSVFNQKFGAGISKWGKKCHDLLFYTVCALHFEQCVGSPAPTTFYFTTVHDQIDRKIIAVERRQKCTAASAEDPPGIPSLTL